MLHKLLLVIANQILARHYPVDTALTTKVALLHTQSPLKVKIINLQVETKTVQELVLLLKFQAEQLALEDFHQ